MLVASFYFSYIARNDTSHHIPYGTDTGDLVRVRHISLVVIALSCEGKK